MRKWTLFWLLLVPDLLLFYAGLYISIALRYEGPAGLYWQSHAGIFSVLFLVWLLVFFMHGLYDPQSLRRFSGLVIKLFAAMTVSLLVAIVYFYFQPNLILTPRRFLLIDITSSFLLIAVWHLLVKYFVKNRLTENLYLFSFGRELGELEKAIEAHKFLGFRVLGHLNGETLEVGKIDSASSIIVPDNLNSRPEIFQKFYALRKRGVTFYNFRDFYESLLRRVYLTEINELWFLENINYKEKRFYSFLKRILDIIFGLLGSIIFAVTWPIVALLVKLSSKGPVMFIQQRVGKDGRIFKVFKYRTMQVDQPANTWTSVNDPRVTAVGRFLRKSRIDEWPQFVNLLIGNMSLVGPRPEQPNIVEVLRNKIPFYDERHLVKPGITGWAQINNIYAGSEEETRLKLQYDLYYIKHRSILFDLEIILKTIYYIFTWQGR